MPTPKISVGIPYTDQGRLLAEAISSVVGQTFQDWELILYGDGPSDETKMVADSYHDSRIRHIIRETRGGLAAALNSITEMSASDLIARMDGDDIMHPFRLEKQFDYLSANPHVDVVGSHAFLIDENSSLVGRYNEPALPSNPKGFLNSNCFTHPTVMGRKAWFENNKYNESLLRAEDKELWLRTGPTSSFAKMNDSLLYYRIPRDVSWRRQARDSAYDRKIIGSFSDLTNRADRFRRYLKSYIKQLLVFGLSQVKITKMIYRNKHTPLDARAYSIASETLSKVLASVNIESPRVLAVTVTYGSRLHLVEKTVRAALDAGAAEVLIVDNGMALEDSAALAISYAEDDAVSIHRLPKNEGSAAGFTAGLQTALETGFDYYWILDDDNVVVKGNVEALVKAHVDLRRKNAVVGVAAVRDVDESHKRILSGLPVSLAYPPRGAFMNFDLINFLVARVRPQIFRAPHTRLIEIPTAPYGGLLVDRSTVEAVGLPNKELGLYEDDTEWTSRISREGVLSLHTDIHIDDLVGKHSHNSGGKGPERLLRSDSQTRVFFAVRNRVHWERGQAEGAILKGRYALNRFVYIAVLSATARRVGAAQAFVSMKRAITAGESGNLREKLSEMVIPT